MASNYDKLPAWKKLDRLSTVITVCGVLVCAAGGALYDIARRAHEDEIAANAVAKANEG